MSQFTQSDSSNHGVFSILSISVFYLRSCIVR